MPSGCTVVLDIGKTLAKLTLWSDTHRLLARASRPNQRPNAPDGYPTLDVAGIESWLAETLCDFSQKGEIAYIIPVAHGAAGCIVKGDRLVVPPVDYEAEMPEALKARYLADRDPFQLTGSPALPSCLNFASQLHWLDDIRPEAADGQSVTWPQYWAWRLSGIARTEVTSLGCHTDLWQPTKECPSPMATKRGWAKRLAPRAKAGDILGPVTEEWQKRCNLPAACQVVCGLHDSNAALLAVRGHPEIGNQEHTVLSTGTWIIAMRSPATPVRISALPEARDCLVNVDAYGKPVPSARFMGGRELAAIEDGGGTFVDPEKQYGDLLAAIKDVIAGNIYALPGFQPGVGPFPDKKGHWNTRPDSQILRRAAADLYLALMADTSLNLIGSCERLVIEGRYAEEPFFTGLLAALRPTQTVYLMPAYNSVSYGAMRLIAPDLPPEATLSVVEPLNLTGLAAYAERWREQAVQES